MSVLKHGTKLNQIHVDVLQYSAIQPNQAQVLTCVAFTLRDTQSDSETVTDKMATVPNGISVSVQYEHIHTIL